MSAVTIALLLYKRQQLMRSQQRRSDVVVLQMPRLSPWEQLIRSRNNVAFRNTTSLTIEAFFELLDRVKSFILPSEPSSDERPFPHLRRRALNSAAILGLTLHYLSSTKDLESICEVFDITPSVGSQYLSAGLDALFAAFRSPAAVVPDAMIEWPTAPEKMEQHARKWVNKEPELAPCRPIAVMDSLRVQMVEPKDRRLHHAYYNVTDKMVCVANVLVFDSDGCIIWWCGNFPGSWSNQTITQDFLVNIRDNLSEPYCMISDGSFYRRDMVDKQSLLIAKAPAKLMVMDLDFEEFSKLLAITSTRQSVQWSMQTLRGTFGRLRTALPLSSERRNVILTCCMHLHNFIIRRVGVSQTQTV